MNSLIQQQYNLWKDIFVEEEIDLGNFVLVKSFFPQWWALNNITSKDTFEYYDFYHAENVIEDYKNQNRLVSFYVEENIQNSSLSSLFEENLYTRQFIDTYVVKSIQNSMPRKYPDTAIIHAEDRFSDYLDISLKAFPEWDNEAEFCKLLFNPVSNDPKGVLNVLFQIEDQIVAAGSLVYSELLDIAYITNTGTLEEYRGKGIQKELISYFNNFCLQKNISKLYSIVEEDSISYSNFLKLGFDAEVRYGCYYKE